MRYPYSVLPPLQAASSPCFSQPPAGPVTPWTRMAPGMGPPPVPAEKVLEGGPHSVPVALAPGSGPQCVPAAPAAELAPETAPAAQDEPPPEAQEGAASPAPSEDTEESDYDPFKAEPKESVREAEGSPVTPDQPAEAGEPAAPEEEAEFEEGVGQDDDDAAVARINALLEMYGSEETEQPPGRSEPLQSAQQPRSHQPAPAQQPGWAHGTFRPWSHGEPAQAPPKAAAAAESSSPCKGQSLGSGEQQLPRKPPKYVFNPRTQRWEAERDTSQAARDGRQGGDPRWRSGGWASGSRGTAPARPAQAATWTQPAAVSSGRKYTISECKAKAKADAKDGTCEYEQALVVRLALYYEAKPEEVLASWAESGMPLGKDRRSTVRALMRLCHPDKCKHPEAKHAMQILTSL